MQMSNQRQTAQITMTLANKGMTGLRVACVQHNSGPNTEVNKTSIERWVTQASDQQADLVLLPENCMQMPSSASTRYCEPAWSNAHPVQSELQTWASDLAKRASLYLVLGSLPVKTQASDKPYARSLAFDPQGKLIAQYDKIHLFDVDTMRDGKPFRYRESDDFAAGGLTPFENGLPPMFTVSKGSVSVKVGMSICYDLRFPE